VAAIEKAPATEHPPSLPRRHEAGPRPADSEPFDLELEVPPDVGTDVTALQHALDAAESLARAGRLLTQPGHADVVAVRDWACGQITAQLADAAPVDWARASAGPPT
jgi:hypothetical protein